MVNYLKTHAGAHHVETWWEPQSWLGVTDQPMIFSHCPYGWPENYIHGDIDYITYLRDPVDRLVSFYYHSLQDLRNAESLGMYLNNFINLVKVQYFGALDNGMTRLLAGRTDIGMIPTEGPVTEKDLDEAKANLENFVGIGTLDEYDKDLKTLADKFGWGDINYERYRTGNRPPVRDHSEEFISVLREATKLDRELYEYAKEIKDDINTRVA